MKKTTKRILALALTLCTVFGLMVPMAFAAADPIVYNFTKTEYENENADWEIIRNTTGFTPNGTDNKWTIKDNGLLVQFNFKYDTCDPDLQIDGTNVAAKMGRWFAIEIAGVNAGTYDATFVTNRAAPSCGIGNVFVVDSEAYKKVDNSYFAGVDRKLTDDEQTDFFADLAPSLIKETQISSYKADVSDGYTKTQPIGNITFAKDGSYVLIFQCFGKDEGSTSVNLSFSSLTLTPVVTEATNVAQVGNEKFTDLQSAIAAAAAASSTAVLLDDVTVDGTLTVKAGATLDLAGYILTADTVQCEPNAKVTDSKDGEGLLAAEVTLQANNGQLPLYDATESAEGYRFFNVTVEKKDNGTVEGKEIAAKLRFKVNFTNTEAAYKLIATGTTGMDIQGAFGGGSTASGSFAYKNETEKTFVQEWAEFADSKNGNAVIYIVLTGLDQVNSLTMTPSVYSAGVIISGEALTAK